MLSTLPLTAGVTLLIVLLMFGTCFAVGKARHTYGIQAPAVSGHPAFERLYRVQMNTLEWAAMTLPALWICAVYVGDGVAAALGGVWLVGRVWYALGYARDPALRARGFGIAALAFGALGLAAGGGVIRHLLGGVRRVLRRVAVLAAIALAGPVGAAPALPALGVEGDGVTVSGISSGGYMAVQFQVAFSRIVKGAGVLAAGPYECAEGSVAKALTRCMAPNRLAPPPTVADSVARVDARARAGQIDAPAGLAEDRAWVLSGGADRTVERPVVEALVGFYRHWLPATSVAFVRLDDASHGLNAGHGMISVSDAQANACATSEPPFINRCGNFDAAGELLRFLLGPLQARGDARAGRLDAFDQRPFVSGLAADAGLAEEGLVYVPDACRAGGCRLHVAFHGCRQNLDQVGRRFAEGAGYAEWAATNRLVVLFPQTVTRNGWAWGSWRWVVNPKGCWDWWGYSGADYATRTGPQMAAVRRMIARLAEAPGR